MVWTPLFLDPSDGVFGRFDLAALAVAAPLFFVCLFTGIVLAGQLDGPAKPFTGFVNVSA